MTTSTDDDNISSQNNYKKSSISPGWYVLYFLMAFSLALVIILVPATIILGSDLEETALPPTLVFILTFILTAVFIHVRRGQKTDDSGHPITSAMEQWEHEFEEFLDYMWSSQYSQKEKTKKNFKFIFTGWPSFFRAIIADYKRLGTQKK
ncbi:MAG: hypothetical protein ABH950_05365 [Candidatus Altiarchaeota archaeon]